MPARNRRSSFGHRPQRRKLVWSVFDGLVGAVPAGDAQGVNLLTQLNVAGASRLGATVMRTHLRIQVPYTANTEFHTLGLVVGRPSDIAVPTAADPANVPELDWMWLERLFPHSSGATVDANRTYTVDSHARRKLEELDQTYILSLSNGAAGAITYAVYCRTLLALP